MTASTIASCRALVAQLDAEIRRLPLESRHRANPALALTSRLDSVLRSEVAAHVQANGTPAPPLAADQTVERPARVSADANPPTYQSFNWDTAHLPHNLL
jgi:hypothetical protein